MPFAVWQLLAIAVVAPAGAAVPRTLDLLGVPGPVPMETYATGLASSPDETSVYVTSDADPFHDDSDGALTVYRRNAATGNLDFVEVHRNGGAIDGLRDASAVAVSPDGAYVYALGGAAASAATARDAVVIFARDAGTGALTFVELERQGVGGIDGLSGANDLKISADGAYVYVTSGDGVGVFGRDAGTGHLSLVEVQRNGVAGVTGLVGAAGLALNPDGAHLYVASAGASAVVVFSRDAGTGRLSFVESQTDGVGGVDGLASARGIAVSPDGASVYVNGNDELAVFARNAGTGQLTFLQVKHGDPGNVQLSAPHRISVSPDGKTVYVAAATLVVLNRNVVTGMVNQTQQHGRDYFSDVLVSSDGAWVYVARDGVPIYARNPATGGLTAIEVERGLPDAGPVVVAPDGASVYATYPGHTYNNNILATFHRDAGTGLLTLLDSFGDEGLEPHYGLSNVGFSSNRNDLAISPDGAHLYVSGFQSVVGFSRDASGRLTYVETQRDGVGGVDGLGGAAQIVVSPDGNYIYVAGQTDNAVAVFGRNAGTGQLTFVEVQTDGVGGVDGLSGASGLALSPDASHLYVASYDDAAVAIFARDAGTGHLTFVGAEHAGLEPGGPSPPTGRARVVAVSPDGTNVYVGGDWTVTVFDRDAGTGALTLAQVYSEAGTPFDEAKFSNDIAISPDGALVYVAGTGILILVRDTGTGLVSLGSVETRGVVDVALSSDGAHLYAGGVARGAGATAFAPGFGGCDPTPAVGCRAGKGQFALVGGRNTLSWSWGETGQAVNFAEFGDPQTTHYALCVYQSAPSQLLLRALVPAGGVCRARHSASIPCWAASGTKVVYKDPYRTPEGIDSMRVPTLAATHPAKLVAKGKGEHLAFPALPLSLPVRVQLQASNGNCWEATYSAPRVNTSLLFRSLAD